MLVRVVVVVVVDLDRLTSLDILVPYLNIMSHPITIHVVIRVMTPLSELLSKVNS